MTPAVEIPDACDACNGPCFDREPVFYDSSAKPRAGEHFWCAAIGAVAHSEESGDSAKPISLGCIFLDSLALPVGPLPLRSFLWLASLPKLHDVIRWTLLLVVFATRTVEEEQNRFARTLLS